MGTMSTAHTASEDGRVHTLAHTRAGGQSRTTANEPRALTEQRIDCKRICNMTVWKNEKRWKRMYCARFEHSKGHRAGTGGPENHNIITIVEQFLVTFIRSSWREFAVLAKFGFGESFVLWIRLLYTFPCACITTKNIQFYFFFSWTEVIDQAAPCLPWQWSPCRGPLSF